MKKTATKILLLLAYIFINTSLFGQGPTCGTAEPFCSDDPTYSFPAGVGSGYGFGNQTLSNVGCLSTTPNSVWYYLQVDQPGRINIHMWSTPSRDLDFICWGPFTASTFHAFVASGGCSQLDTATSPSHGPSSGVNPSDLGGYPIGNIIDCSYSSNALEYVHIPDAISGNWYILLITNYSNQSCQISFNSHVTSTGSTNCTILRSLLGDSVCVGATATLTVHNPPAGAVFTFEGPNGFFQSSLASAAVIPNAQIENAGTYTLVITPVGEPSEPPSSAQLIVTEKSMPIFSQQGPYCLGSVSDLLPDISTNGIAGTWNPSIISTDTSGEGHYLFTPNDGQCGLETTIVVRIRELPVLTCPDDFTVTEENVLRLSGAVPTDGVYSGMGVIGSYFDPLLLGNGDYTIVYSYTDTITGCSNSCDFTITVDLVNDIDVNEISKIGIYPNPNQGVFTISFSNINGKVKYQIYDTKGSIIIDKNIQTNGNTIEEVPLKLLPGIYFVRVITETQTVFEKLIIQ